MPDPDYAHPEPDINMDMHDVDLHQHQDTLPIGTESAYDANPDYAANANQYEPIADIQHDALDNDLPNYTANDANDEVPVDTHDSVYMPDEPIHDIMNQDMMHSIDLMDNDVLHAGENDVIHTGHNDVHIQNDNQINANQDQ